MITKKTFTESRSFLEKIAESGSREVARILINARVKIVTLGFLTLEDLPDRREISEITDEIESLINSGTCTDANLKRALSGINTDLLRKISLS